VRFVLLTEGATEAKCLPEFLKRWLDPQLGQPLAIQAVDMRGYPNFQRDLVRKARLHLSGPRASEIVAVIGLLDLYAPDLFPQDLQSSDEKYVWGVEHFEGQVGHKRFRMFFAVHELEAWLLSQAKLFPREVEKLLPKQPPEEVNSDRPPAKRLNEAYRQAGRKTYKKTVDGINLFRKLDPNVAADKCPRLKQMLETMLELAQAAGH